MAKRTLAAISCMRRLHFYCGDIISIRINSICMQSSTQLRTSSFVRCCGQFAVTYTIFCRSHFLYACGITHAADVGVIGSHYGHSCSTVAPSLVARY